MTPELTEFVKLVREYQQAVLRLVEHETIDNLKNVMTMNRKLTAALRELSQRQEPTLFQERETR